MATVSVKVQRRGGDRLRKLLREAGRGGVKGVRVGFFSTAKYEDGTPVAAVAAWNEFGTGPHTIRPKDKRVLAFTGESGQTVFARSVQHPGVPERPFFRRAIVEMEDGIADIIADGIDTERMVIDPKLADTVGAYAAGQVQESITALKEPPNAPETVQRKGSTNPLIDTGFMRGSVSYEVDR